MAARKAIASAACVVTGGLLHRMPSLAKHRATITVAELQQVEKPDRPDFSRSKSANLEARSRNGSPGSSPSGSPKGRDRRLQKQASFGSPPRSPGRIKKSKSMIFLPGERNRFFDWAPDELAPEVVETCAAAARAQANQLPKDSSEVRLARLRQPRGALERRLRHGAAFDDVLGDAALRVVEKWVAAMRSSVPEACLAEAVAHLVHGDLSAKTLPEGPLAAALQRVVPQTKRVARDGWDFVDALVEALESEDRLDKKSVVNVAGPHNCIRLSRACGSQPKVWAPGPSMSDLARAGRQTDGFRSLATSVSSEKVAWMHVPNSTRQQGGPVPGPGHYAPWDYDLSLGIRRPNRGEFPSVGRKRAVCLTAPLYHRLREL